MYPGDALEKMLPDIIKSNPLIDAYLRGLYAEKKLESIDLVAIIVTIYSNDIDVGIIDEALIKSAINQSDDFHREFLKEIGKKARVEIGLARRLLRLIERLVKHLASSVKVPREELRGYVYERTPVIGLLMQLIYQHLINEIKTQTP